MTKKNLHPIEEELLKKVRSLTDAKKKFRVLGRGHSQTYLNRLCCAENEIDMTQFLAPMEYNDETQMLTTSAGYSLGQVRDFLKQYNSRLYGTPESYDISIGGAIVVGAHSGSDVFGFLTENVQEMWLISGMGEIEIITNKNLFINYGNLGVVFRLVIKCYPANNVIWTHKYHSNVSDIKVSSSTHSVYFGPYSGICLQTKVATTDYHSNYTIAMWLWIIFRYISSLNIIVMLVEFIIRYLPFLGIFISEFSLWEPNSIRSKYDYYDYIPNKPVYSLEYSIDQKVWKKCYQELIALFTVTKAYVTYRFWTRFLPSSSMDRALSYGRDSALMEVTFSKNQPYANDMAREINKIMLKYGGRPHMGKTIIDSSATSNYDFTDLRRAMQIYDPNRLCLNEFGEKIFYS